MKGFKVMKNKDLSTLKYVILGVLFMAVSVVTFFSMDYQSLSASVTTMSASWLYSTDGR